MKIEPIHCLKDNYAYLLIDEQTDLCAVVDPSEAEPVLQALTTLHKKRGRPLTLVAILNTHHHWDHTGGNQGLLEACPDLKVYGHASDRGRIAGQTVFLNDGDLLQVGRLQGRVVHNPGHTTGAVSYAFEDALFTGDTLFGAGCGRTFEAPEQMYASLMEKIGSFADDTRIYFGHEYTAANLRFAMEVEPLNSDVRLRSQRAVAALAAGRSTTPSTLGEEKVTNPFLRCHVAEVFESVRRHEPGLRPEPADVFRVLRAWKDRY